MSKEHAQNLFARHLEDLRIVCPNAGEVFVCPICFEVSSRDDLEAGKLNPGHVWPDLIRQSSEIAKHQQVLLCIKCNSESGRRGEKMVQDFERIREEEKTSGVRHIQVGHPGREWVDLRARVQKTNELSFTFQFRLSQSGQPLHNDPEKYQRFKELSSEEGFSVKIYPHYIFDWINNPNYKLTWPLIQVGLLTSAYLLAFFNLGYRYVLQSYLDPVRDCILKSFKRGVDDGLDFDEQKDVCVAMVRDDFLEEPLCGLFVSTREGTPDHLEISFLDFRIRLPFRHSFQCEVVEGIPYWKIDTSNRLVTLPLWCEPMTEYPQVPPSDSEKSGFCIVAPFRWDMIVDEPDYCVVGSSLVRKDE